jgi:hypothetical protein
MIFCTSGWRTTSAAVKWCEIDAGDVAQDARGLERPDCLGARQVDLGDVAGDDHARVVAEAGEEHHHLLGRGVLRLVEDDEGVGACGRACRRAGRSR